MLRLKARRNLEEAGKAADEQACSDEQENRQAKLSNNECSAKPAARGRRRGAASHLVEQLSKISSRDMPHGSEAKEQAGKQRNAKCKREYTWVEPDLIDARRIGGNQQSQGADAPVRKYKPEKSTAERQKHAFGEQLAREPCSTGTQRRPHGEFQFTRRSLGQQQIGNVGAGNEKHERDSGEKHKQRRANATNELFLHRHHVNAEILRVLAVVAKICSPEIVPETGEPRRSFGRVHARFQSRDDVQIVRAAVLRFGTVQGQRGPKVLITAERKVLRQNTEDGVGLSVKLDRSVYDVPIAAKLALPERIAEQSNVAVARLVFIQTETSTENRLDSEKWQHVSHRVGGSNLYGACVGASEVRATSQGVSANLRKGLIAIEQVPVLGLGNPVLRYALLIEFSPDID